MSQPDSRPALGSRKRPRPHPASPEASAPVVHTSTLPGAPEVGLVMLCVRVEPVLRRRVKLAAVASGRTIQELAVEALEGACRRHDA